MAFADTHCHLDFSDFDSDLEALIDRCVAKNVLGFVVPGTSRTSWEKQNALASVYPSVKPAFGLHPYFVQEHQKSDLEALEQKISEDPRCVAVGEIGLDATRPLVDSQRELFSAQLALAEKYRLPVILHSYKTHDEVAKTYRTFDIVGGVVHGFSGSEQQLQNLVASGLKIGVGGVITWARAAKTRRAVANAPLDALVLETDAPDMPLQDQPEKRNSSVNIPIIFNALVELRAESSEIIEQALWDNSEALFGRFVV